MSRSYYVIELTARWLTVLLVGLALLMVVAFGLGYGAAVSVNADGSAPRGELSPTPVVMTEVVLDATPPQPRQTPTLPVATATARPMPPTVAPAPATPTPKPTEKPRPTEKPAEGFWVQVLASSKEASIEGARTKLVDLGFDRDYQEVVRSEVAGGDTLFKLRVGPFPNRESADRVLQRMQGAGFQDAWVVVP
jgi:cell division septation protein DedD